MHPTSAEETLDRSLYPRLAARLPLAMIGRAFYPFRSLSSTQDFAKRLAADGAPDGTVVVADSQTHGRGRLGRSWFAEPGMNLLISVLFRPAVPFARLPQLSLVAAVASAETIRDLAGLDVGIRWPNDVLVGERKVAGILAESASGDGEVACVVVGIGVNVNQTGFPEEIRTRATSLAIETGGPLDREGLLGALLESLDRWYQIFLESGFLPPRAAWRRFSVTLGQEVNTSGVTGTALDMDEEGALVVLTESGSKVRVLCGELQ